MINWTNANLVTVAIVAIIAIFTILAVISLVKNRKKGKTCSCGCENCVYSSGCSKDKRTSEKTN